MFWKEAKGFKDLPMSSKIAISMILVLAGFSYILGFLNIWYTYSPADQKPGLSVQDVRIAFWGARGTTKLEKAIDGTMREYFQNDAEHQTVKEWISAGAPESEWPQIKEIFDGSCNSCHSADEEVAGVVLATYPDVQQYLAQDTGKSIPRLISLTHTHLPATLVVIFMLLVIFGLTRYSETVKRVVMTFSLAALAFDLGSWWLAKISPALAVLVILGGISLALTFGALVLLSLWELWIRRD